MIAVFEPFHGIGEFEFNVSIDTYFNDFEFEVLKKEGKYDCDKYIIQNPELSLFVDENNLIESISCSEECLFKGRNIIGMYINEFTNFFDIIPESDVDLIPIGDDMQEVYEFDDLGLQVWCSNNKIVTIIAGVDERD